MRKMVYKLEDGTIVNTWKAAAGHSYKVELVTITPPDEIEARIKYNKERVKLGYKTMLPIHY